MPGIPVPLKAIGDTFTSGDYTRYLRNNFNEGVPAIMTSKGDIAVSTAIRTAGALGVGDDYQTLQASSSEALGVEYSSAIGVSVWSFLYKQEYAVSGMNYMIDFILDGSSSSKILYQSHTFFDPATTLNKFIIPEGMGGVYLIDFTMLSFFGTDPGCYTTITMGGDVGETFTEYFASDTTYPFLFSFYPHAQTIKQLDAGDYVDFSMSQTGATNCRFLQPLVSIYKLR